MAASNLFFLITVLLSISFASSLKCYACNRNTCKSNSYVPIECYSSSGSFFGDQLKSTFTPQCMKIEGIDVNGNAFQERNCTTNIGPMGCELQVKTIETAERAKKVQCYLCENHLCNSGSKLFATFGLLLSSVLFLF